MYGSRALLIGWYLLLRGTFGVIFTPEPDEAPALRELERVLGD